MQFSLRSTTFAVATVATITAAAVSPLAAQGASAAPAPPAAPMITPPPAKQVMTAAIAKAKATNKTVLVKFSASWCGWCHRFDEFLKDPVMGKIMYDNYEIVTLIVSESPDKKALEHPGSADIMKEMGNKSGGIPFFFALDGAGNKIGDSNVLPDGGNVGHPATPEEVNGFVDIFIPKTAPRITPEARELIRAHLTKMNATTK